MALREVLRSDHGEPAKSLLRGMRPTCLGHTAGRREAASGNTLAEFFVREAAKSSLGHEIWEGQTAASDQFQGLVSSAGPSPGQPRP